MSGEPLASPIVERGPVLALDETGPPSPDESRFPEPTTPFPKRMAAGRSFSGKDPLTPWELGTATTPMRTTREIPPPPVIGTDGSRPQLSEIFRREREHDRRERELDRREREIERRERELERRSRELEDRISQLEDSKDGGASWHKAIEDLRVELMVKVQKAIFLQQTEIEEKVMKQVNSALERERELYVSMSMADNDVNELVEDTVGYYLKKDEDLADRVRLQSLFYLAQESIALEAGIAPDAKTGSITVAWSLALGPSMITEERYKKALELLADKPLQEKTKKLLENQKAVEYVVEYTSHLRKEVDGSMTFAPGRIARSAYLESVERQFNQPGYDAEALKALVDFVAPEK